MMMQSWEMQWANVNLEIDHTVSLADIVREDELKNVRVCCELLLRFNFALCVVNYES